MDKKNITISPITITADTAPFSVDRMTGNGSAMLQRERLMVLLFVGSQVVAFGAGGVNRY